MRVLNFQALATFSLQSLRGHSHAQREPFPECVAEGFPF